MSDGLLEPLFCPKCSYDLRGSAGERCPECGHDLSEFRAGLPVIPWTARRLRGRMSAFWATVWMVSLRKRGFLNKFGQVVEYRDARRFQVWVVLHAYLPMLVATVYLYVMAPPGAGVNSGWSTKTLGGFPFPFNRVEQTTLGLAYAAYWPAVLVHVGYLLFLFAATGVQSYFFHPKSVPVRLQNNAVAMSYYMAAPLALTTLMYVGLTAALAISSLWIDIEPRLLMGILLHIQAVGSLIGGLVWTWELLFHSGRKMMPQEEARWWVMAAALPVLWMAMGVICVAVIPAVVFYVLVAVRSLTG